MMFNKRMTFFAQCDQITKLICCLIIAVEQAVWNNVVNIYDGFSAALLPFTAYLASSTIPQKRGTALLIPVFAPPIIRRSVFVHWIVCARFVAGHVITHAATRAKATATFTAILSFVYRKDFSTDDAGYLDKVFRSAFTWMRCVFASIGGALRRTKDLFVVFGIAEHFPADRTRSCLHSASLSLYHRMLPAGGVISRFSGATLADTTILPQIGAIC